MLFWYPWNVHILRRQVCIILNTDHDTGLISAYHSSFFSRWGKNTGVKASAETDAKKTSIWALRPDSSLSACTLTSVTDSVNNVNLPQAWFNHSCAKAITLLRSAPIFLDLYTSQTPVQHKHTCCTTYGHTLLHTGTCTTRCCCFVLFFYLFSIKTFLLV